MSRLLVFGSAPSKECGRCLLTKFGLAQFTVRLFWRFDDQWHLAFNIFDALPPHTLAGGYMRPIHAPHTALHPQCSQQSRREMQETGGFALAPQRYVLTGSSGLSNRSAKSVPEPALRGGDDRSNEAIIHPRFATWYKSAIAKVLHFPFKDLAQNQECYWPNGDPKSQPLCMSLLQNGP